MNFDEDEIGRALSSLADVGTNPGWREPRELKRIAVRRRRRRWGLSVVAVAVVAAGAITAVNTGNASAPQPTKQQAAQGLRVGARSGSALQLVANARPLAKPDTKLEQAIVTAEQEFAIKLLQQTNKAGRDDNVVLSPSSLAIALAMLQNGANGQTRDEIAKTLQTSELANTQQDAGWASLTAELTQAGSADGISLESANSLWLQRGLPMTESFMTAMATYFQTGVWQVDFAGHLAAANQAINDWAAAHTNGKITKLFDDGALDPSTLLVLANAVYFKAAWQTAFARTMTRNAEFHHADGTTSTIPFMASETSAAPQAASNDAYDAVQLPYQGKRFAALVVMPKQQSLPAFVNNLTAAKLAAIAGDLTMRAEVRIPRFTVKTYADLTATLSAMGMPTVLTPAADLSAMSPTPLCISTVVQRDYLRVNETGTEAAAVTGIRGVALSAGSGPLTIVVDHPFLFLIRDTKTGAILFTAQIEDPSAAPVDSNTSTGGC